MSSGLLVDVAKLNATMQQTAITTLQLLAKRADPTPNTFREHCQVHRTGPGTIRIFHSNANGNLAERNTIIAACIMFVAIIIAWNLPVLRDVISALKVRGDRLR